MSWADDIRCLFCDGRLPLYRKITNGQFCSSAHRKAYWQEQERLAVERLHQTHDSLRAYRPAGLSVDAILGQAEAPQEAKRPRWLTLANTGQVPEIGFVPDPTRLHPRWLREKLAEASVMPADGVKAVRHPVFFYEASSAGVRLAGLVNIPVSEQDSAILPVASIDPLGGRVEPVYNLALDFLIEGDELDRLVEIVQEVIPGIAGRIGLSLPLARVPAISEPFEIQAIEFPAGTYARLRLAASIQEAIPGMSGLLALLQPAAHRLTIALLRADSSPLAMLLRMRFPLGSAPAANTNAPESAGSVALPMLNPSPSCGQAPEEARALDLRSKAASPELTLSTPPVLPQLRFAAGRRYAVRAHQPMPLAMEPAALSATQLDVSLPQRNTKAAPVRNAKQSAAAAAPMQEPNAAGLVSLPFSAKPKSAGATLKARAGTASLPQPVTLDPMLPTARFEPIEEADVRYITNEFAISMPPYAPLEAPAEHPRAHLWTHASDFWNRAPRDLKLLAIAIPILLGLALHPALPKVRVSSPANTTGMQLSFENAMNTQWTNVRKTLVDRAAVALDEDFRAGLDDWASRWTQRGEANAEWSFDATGFVRPGPLALYKPSVGLTDYQMQFLGMIDKKAMSWVVRAADFDNYYVVKLEVLKPGPLPTLGLTRYAVVHGKPDSRVDTPVPIDARSDTLYRVVMDVHGDEFVLTVQGQVIDAWSEPRLKHGGVGFFSARGEDSRVRWVQVTHQYDMLGRLCAYLAPYNIPSSSGSLEP